MTHEEKGIAMDAVLQPLFERGFDGIQEVLATIFNVAMRAEREKVLCAELHERTEERRGYANGFKPKTLKTRMGELSLRIPQVRGDVSFYPSALERGQRGEKALALAAAEMYVNGVSTRRVRNVMEALCGFDISASQVSEAAKMLDAELEKWRNRPIGCTKALVLDAMYEQVRMNGSVVSCAVLIATGIQEDGHRSILGVSASLSEAEPHWRTFLHSLKNRGLNGVSFIVSDDHEGLKAALRATFPGVPWQRCQTHLQRNAQAYVTKADLRSTVAADIRAIFNAPSRQEAERLLAVACEKYAQSQAKLASWMEDNLPDGFAVFALPEHMRRRLRTSNLLEMLNRQIRRRTRVVGLFPNEESLIRLISAILMETSEDWETDKVYLNMEGMP
jgi:transposase-like protein